MHFSVVRRSILLVVCVPLLLSCGKKEPPRILVKSPPPPVAPAPDEPDRDAGSRSAEAKSPPLRDDEAIVDALLQGLDMQAAAARREYELGRHDAGRHRFEKLLKRLQESVDFPNQPRLERKYYLLLDEFQRLEVNRLAADTDFPLPSFEDLPFENSPLDEMAGVNLYPIEIDPDLRETVHEELLEIRFDFPVVLNDDVLSALNYHRGRGRKQFELGLKRLGRFQELFHNTFEEFGLPKDLIYMSFQESRFNPRAYSRAHARGLWQFTSAAAKDYDLDIDWWVDERSDILKSTRSAARYLRNLYDMFGDWYLVLAAYNSGPGRIQRVLRRHGDLDYWEMRDRKLLPRETRNFVPLILGSMIIFKAPERFGFDVKPDPPLDFELVPVKDQVELKAVAKLIGMPSDALAALNPEVRRGVTPHGWKDYHLKVPRGAAKGLQEKLAKLPRPKRPQFAKHRVRRGENLGMIARRYGTTVTAIAQLNRLRSIHRIRERQELLVPVGRRTAPPTASSSRSVQPGSARHIVRSGDSLYAIARRYGVTVAELRRWNNLGRSNRIYPGQAIRISTEGSR